MLRIETKSRARAIQILYAWELQGAPPIPAVVSGLARLTGPEPRILDRAEALASDIVADVNTLDAQAASAAENWVQTAGRTTSTATTLATTATPARVASRGC